MEYSVSSTICTIKESQRGRGQVFEAETRSRPATCRYFWIRTHGDNANNIYCSTSEYVFVMNVAMIQPRNGYNRYALDSTIFDAKLLTPRPDRGQTLEAEASLSRPRPKFWPVWPRGPNITGVLDTSSVAALRKQDAWFCELQSTPVLYSTVTHSSFRSLRMTLCPDDRGIPAS